MPAGWSVLDALNKTSKAAVEEKPRARFRTKDISIKEMYPNEGNFYSMGEIEELAQKILAVGLLENMTVTYCPCEKGNYKIIAGERRWRALNLLVSQGYEEFDLVTCQIKPSAEESEEKVQLIIANSYREKTMADTLKEARELKESLQVMRENGTKLQGYDLDSGRLRDAIASIMHMTTTKIAQIESINKRLLPELREALEKGGLKFSAAYELSGMEEEQQEQFAEKLVAGEEVTHKEIKRAKAEMKEDAACEGEEQEPEEEQLPGQMNLDDYEEDSYQKKTEWSQEEPERKPVEKTPEQIYDEEQAAIDRKTREKLREMEQEEKMNHLPSDNERKRRTLRVPARTYGEIKDGKLRHLILNDDQVGYKENDIITLLAFSQGRATGERLRVCVTYVDTSETSNGIVEGYVVIGIMDVYDAEAMGMIDLGDED